MDIKLSVPFDENLMKESGWNHLDKYLYFAARLHLHIEQNQTPEFAFGDILRTYHTTSFSEAEVVKSFEEEFTVIDLRETIRSATLSKDLTRKLSATIAGAAKSPLYEVSAGIGPSLEQTIRSSLAASMRTSDTVSRREKRTFTVSHRIKSGASELQLAVAAYRRYSRRVYLHYIDYLFVEYKRSAFGLRKKKRNRPRPVGDAHLNILPINMPLFKLLYWNLEMESSLVYTESEYQRLPKVAHPDHAALEELHEAITLPAPAHSDQPTLYTLSNIAFPLRWVDRKGPWTREELERIELEEAEGSAWWYEHGPGREK